MLNPDKTKYKNRRKRFKVKSTLIWFLEEESQTTGNSTNEADLCRIKFSTLTDEAGSNKNTDNHSSKAFTNNSQPKNKKKKKIQESDILNNVNLTKQENNHIFTTTKTGVETLNSQYISKVNDLSKSTTSESNQLESKTTKGKKPF